MSDYSGYQSKRAHSLGPFTSVHEATAPDGRPGRFALKIFHPPPSTGIRRAYAIEGWLLAVERQQKAAKKDGAVLEIVAFGRCPEGAYCVMPWQERSLEPLVNTLAAKGDLLRALAETLFNALEQWAAQTGGTHRNLKPSNIFPARSGPLQGMPVVLSDPWFRLGARAEKTRVNDLPAVGAILAQIVRRREVAAWPIEDAPEWKALGHPGKAWLAYVNFLLDPQPASGELTIAEARRRLRAIPKDARPARTAALTGAAVLALAAAGVVAFARFGNPIYMPDQIQRLAEKVGNPRAKVTEVPREWADLCVAWDTWLIDLQSNGGRLLKTEGLWEPNDPLRKEIADFLTTANDLLPATLVPESANEKRLGVLANTPPPDVLSELLTTRVSDKVKLAGARLVTLKSRLENWSRWEQMRALLKVLDDRGFTRASAALSSRLPPARTTAAYKLDIVRTLKFFNDLSLDSTGTLLLASRWSEMTKLTDEMKATNDRVQKAMPDLILARLVDHSSIGDFADSLADPLAELHAHRQRFLDPQVVRERFLKESKLQAETADVTVADFPRWEEQLALFSKVPAADDPRLVATLDDAVKRLPATAVDLEADAPAAEPGGLLTLSTADFRTEFQSRQAELTALRAKAIVRIDLPAIAEETNQLSGRFQLLDQRVEATLALLKPEIWLAKVAQAYGKFNETKQRWAAWQATISALTPAVLKGDRPRFRALRAQERQVREWIDGLEGADGLGALAVPDLTPLSTDTAEALRTLEAARREQTATAAAAAAEWRAALPVTPWANISAAVREPLAAHRQWLADLPVFGADLDRLSGLLAGGFSWNEGVSEVFDRLAKRPGLDALTGHPAEWNIEARLLGRLVDSTDRAALAAAAQSGGLSRKLTAWRRLGTLAGWPAGPDDLDLDGSVVAALREIVGRDVKDEARKGSLTEELASQTRVRWNHAARNSAGDVAKMSAVFERMPRYNIAESDLDAPALYNLKLWQLKRSDWSEVDLAPLRKRRDDFVTAVRAITDVVAQPAVGTFVKTLADIELIVDPNRKPTPSPRLAGWSEELTDAGLGLTATWKNGGKTVKLDFAIVQPPDDTPPFYLARRAVAVGEFLDLLATRSKEEAGAVLDALPPWTRTESYDKPYNKPIAWRPRIDSTGRYDGFELNPTWFFYTTAAVKGLLDDPEVRTQHPELEEAVTEKPTLRSPLQLVPPDAAKILAEKMLGARLPTLREWQTVLKTVGTPPAGNFRGPTFQRLFAYLRDYNVAGQTIPWRPNEGAFPPMIANPGTTLRRKYVDDGAAAPGTDGTKLWFSPVDEGPAPGGFVNLTGNVSIYLYDGNERQFYVAGGSVLSPPGIDFTQPQKVESGGLIGAKPGKEPYTDVGIRPAFDAPPGFKERYKLLVLVRQQGFLTW
jgi:hypothetical protein